jgi:DNA repair protein RecN (Recombination protein N)
MLKALSVTNYALIEKAEIPFFGGFSVITGETGAGKSILLGALGLILGQRADASVLRDKELKCVVEAEFDIASYRLGDLLAENDLDDEPVAIIRREVLPTGKSRAFFNDTPVNLSVLKDISSRLIDIHSQHQTLLLGDNHFQMEVVDAVANSSVQKYDYESVFKAYRKMVSDLEALRELSLKQQQELDYLTFQYQQLVDARLLDGEQVDLEQRLQQLTHAAEIKSALLFAVEKLDGDTFPVLASVKDIQLQLSKVVNYLPDGSDFLARLESAFLDLKDLSNELLARADHLEYDADEIATMQARLGLLYELQQKHRVASCEELIAIRDRLALQIADITGYAERIASLESGIADVRTSLLQKATILTNTRKASFAFIENALVTNLVELGMPSARFVVNHQPKTDFGPDGMDDVSFLFSANKAGVPAPLEKVASGGEMSRLMLCIKAMLGTAKGLPTLILDEIDTGVSGEIADKMGIIMGNMANNMQVVTISHLPQIAGRGAYHYKVCKTDMGSYHSSSIELLNDNQRIVEIAKMLSGAELSEAALNNAKELLRKS